MSKPSSHLDAVEAHIRSFFAGHTLTPHVWSIGPTARLMPEFHVLCIHPYNRFTEFFTYISVGASTIQHDSGRLLEFVIIAPTKDERHVELLTMVAYYHKTEHLELGHTFPIGESWLAGSNCDHMLVSLPYPFGQDLEICCLRDLHIHILWLLPITLAEHQFKTQHGLEALERRFDDCRINFCDVTRTSVV